jgi:hypothetical protein
MTHLTGRVEAMWWLARVQGASNVAGGLWPLVNMRSFERIFGPKVDVWLVRTVAGLLTANGWSQLATAPTPDSVRVARRLGMGTAATLLAVDLVYVSRGRIARTYLLDAIVEAGWLAGWVIAGSPRWQGTGTHPG